MHRDALETREHAHRDFDDAETRQNQAHDRVGVRKIRGVVVPRKIGEGLPVHRLVPGGRIGKALPRDERRHLRKKAHSDPPRRRDLVAELTQEPRADGDVRVSGSHRREQRGCARGIVLSVGIHLDDVVVP